MPLLRFCSARQFTGICFATFFSSFGFADNGVPVAVATVKQQNVYYQVGITGSVTSPGVSRLSPATSGIVDQIHVSEGDLVKRNTVLLELDAELAALKWQSAKADQQQAMAALEDSRRRLQEAERLAPQRSIAKTAVRDLEAEVAIDEATAEKTRAEAEYQRAVLKRHKIAAPFDGVISKKLTEKGEWVTQGQGVLELVSSEGLRLDFAVAEDYLTAIDHDVPVSYVLNAFPEQRRQGKIQAIVPVTETGARTFLLRVGIDAHPDIMPGMSANATLLIPDRDSGPGLVVPRDATVRYPDGRMIVWIVEQTPSGVVVRETTVMVGKSFNGLIEILQGLSVDQLIVVEGNESLRDGQQVRISTSQQG